MTRHPEHLLCIRSSLGSELKTSSSIYRYKICCSPAGFPEAHDGDEMQPVEFLQGGGWPLPKVRQKMKKAPAGFSVRFLHFPGVSECDLRSVCSAGTETDRKLTERHLKRHQVWSPDLCPSHLKHRPGPSLDLLLVILTHSCGSVLMTYIKRMKRFMW